MKKITMIEMKDKLDEFNKLKPCCKKHNPDGCIEAGRGYREDFACCKKCPEI